MKSIVAIKRFFEADPHGRKVDMAELKELSIDERDELGRLCCAALGVEWEPSKAAA